MPSTRQRWTITETDEITRAIDAAAKRWPQVKSRQQLLVRLIDEGHDAIENDRERKVEERRRAIRETAGMFRGQYPRGYLEDLREDWPQ